ncbi:MAG: T9SS type A sorting domain-containing protein [Ignavibacteriaceae bacterium]|jgi:photosystem II stability/assembly factor-like uncharacterized protein
MRLFLSLILIILVDTTIIKSQDLQTDELNFWIQTNGPVGEQIKALTINLDNDIFAGSWISSGQVFRSFDDGDTWMQVTNWTPQNQVWALIVNPAQHIFAGTNGGAGIYCSKDNGDTWQSANNGLTNNHVNDLAISINGHIFAATDYGMFRSTDTGTTWIEINNGLPASDNIVYTVNVDKYGTIFIGTFGNGIYRSTDNGDNWVQKNNGLIHYFINSITISESDIVFAGPDDGQAIFRSTNNGDTWEPFNNGLPSWNVSYVLVVNTDGTVFAGGNTCGVYRSTDDGQTWEEFNSGLTNLSVYSLAINKNNYLFAGTGGDGVFRTTKSTTSIITGSTFLPKSLILEQNYPNPFNSVTYIQYFLPRESKVSLNIYNLVGQKVKRLINEVQRPGWKSISWGGTNSYGKEVSSGFYIYKIEAEGIIKSQRMLLLK